MCMGTLEVHAVQCRVNLKHIIVGHATFSIYYQLIVIKLTELTKRTSRKNTCHWALAS